MTHQNPDSPPPAPESGTPSRVDVVQDYVRTRIATGEFPAGLHLKERDIAEATGISRIPVREALRGLAREGFVVIREGRGVVVAEFSPQKLDQMAEVVEALEVKAVLLAIENATQDDIDGLMGNVHQTRAALEEGDTAAASSTNESFHQHVYGASHNPMLLHIVEPARTRLSWLLRYHETAPIICELHGELAEAIADRDPARAEQAAIRHVRGTVDLVHGILFPDAPTP